MHKDKQQKEAYHLRYAFFNTYEKKEQKWHDKYKNHELYEVVNKSFEYKFHEIANIMPKLLENMK